MRKFTDRRAVFYLKWKRGKRSTYRRTERKTLLFIFPETGKYVVKMGWIEQ